jgi:uncharacterized protein YbaR (Trm112 family)
MVEEENHPGLQMVTIEEQARRGLLVCPETKQQLGFVDGALETEDGRGKYPVVAGVPIFLPEAQRNAMLAQHDASMHREYTGAGRRDLGSIVDSLFSVFGDQRSRGSVRASQQFLSGLRSGDLCVSVGGGPTRFHPMFLNLNIERFANVEVVADAHALPWGSNSVRAIECEAVLEHLTEPKKAVAEMHRVLVDRGEVFCITPFLQKFHAYPNHFNNFTLHGHELIFREAGFSILQSGVCVGPSWMITDMLTEYAGMLVPVRGLRAVVMTFVRVLGIPIRWIDLILNRSQNAHLLASTTFVLASKSD